MILLNNVRPGSNVSISRTRLRSQSIILKLLACTIFALSITRSNGQVIGVIGPAIDEDSCYEDLRAADNNNSQQISEAEFVTFISLQSDESVTDGSTTFSSLPSDFINLFTSLACKCNDCKSTCDESFSIKGTGINENTSIEETVSLFQVCSKTYKQIQDFVPETLPPIPPPVPTMTPTNNPTATPTLSPTKSPTVSPTKNPTNSPTTSPTKNPSKSPTLAPTNAPTPSPTPRVTPAPSVSPTRSPLSQSEGFTGDIPIEFEFTLGYKRELSAMDVIEEEGNQLRLNMIESIESFVDWIVSRHFSRLRNRSRKLLVTNQAESLPIILDIEERECPTGTDSNILEEIPEETTCFDMRSIITIYVENERQNIIALEFEQHIQNSLAERELQVIAKAIDGDIVFVNMKQNVPLPIGNGESITLSAGELAGIGAAGFVVGFALIGGMFIQSRRRRFGKRAQELNDFDDEMLQDTEGGSKKNGSRSLQTYGMTEQPVGIGVQQISESGSYSASDRSFSSSYESSNAGSSGWSSGGLSSMNASSVDSFDADRVQTHGATLATIGLASGITNNLMGQAGPRVFNTRTISNNTRTNTSDGDTLSTNSDHNVIGHFGVEGIVPNMPSVSRNDLDAAIQAGDWAAVGATAALLANAASDTNSVSTRSYNSKRSTTSSSLRSNSNSAMSSVDAARAAELDHLVDTGDWEGVVLAASKFEAASDKGSSQNSAMSISSEDIQSFTNSFSSVKSGDGRPANFDTSESRSISSSTTWSQNEKRIEIRKEVESLVRRVVPDEIDNVDEMMRQFQNREEELLETLRTMQERSIAQKARTAGQKSAKRDAKNKRLGVFGPAGKAVPSMTSTISTKPSIQGETGVRGLSAILAGITGGGKPKKQVELSIDSRSLSSQDANSLSSGGKKQSALDKAIDSGDWEAVGEAAAMMSDTDSDRYGSDSASFSSGTGTNTDSSGGFNIRGSELDMLIDSGNWQGVVDAATKYGESGTPKGSKKSEGTTKKLFGKKDKSDSDSDSGSNSSSSFGRMWKSRKNKKKKQSGGMFGKKTKVVEKIADKKVTTAGKNETAAQADLWMELAAQSKQEGSAQGASDAADWAISRSLSALLKTENKPPGSKASVDSSKDESV